jgi:hypothetical protein
MPPYGYPNNYRRKIGYPGGSSAPPMPSGEDITADDGSTAITADDGATTITTD